MTATVTASIASLILTIPVQTDYDTYEDDLPVGDPVIQDVATVNVWASTSTGFTPDASNLVYAGKSLTVTIANLEPLTTYYLRYAFISEADPDNIEYSAELSGTPNKIDGSIIVDGSVTATKLAAGAVTTSKLSVQGRNMLTDVDSFEQYLGKEPPGSSGSSTNTSSTDFAYHGRYSLKHVSSAINSYKYLNPTGNNANGWVRLEVGKVYIVSAYVRTTSASATSVTLYAGPFEFGTTTAAGTAQSASLSISASQGWQRISVVVSSVTGTNPAMRFYCRNASSGITTYWDGFMIEERVGTDNTPSPFTPGGTTVIDGGNIVADTITASSIQTTALRGKLLAGNILTDRGSLVTTTLDVSAGTIYTEYTVALQDTLDFPPIGAVIHLPSSDSWAGDVLIFRYTGKTATSLTGLSGIYNTNAIAKGDILIPISALSQAGVTDYDGLGELLVGWQNFRQTAGTKSAIAVPLDGFGNHQADFFTYTGAGNMFDQPVLTGVSGLTAWSGIQRVIIDDPGFPTVTVAAAGDYKTFTTNTSNNAYIPAAGGSLAFISTVGSTWVGVLESYSGTALTLTSAITFPDAGTYTVVPLQNIAVLGASLPLFAYSTIFGDWSWTGGKSVVSRDLIYAEGQVQGVSGGVFTSSEYAPIYGNGAGLAIGTEPRNASDIPPTGWNPFDGSIGANYFNSFGIVWGDTAPLLPPSGDNSYIAWVTQDFNGPVIRYFQPISSRLLFSDTGNENSITFDDGLNIYSFNADGGAANANIAALRLALGTAAVSSSASINITDSMSVNSTRYGINNALTITAATLTADRTIRGAYNSVQLQYQNAAAFSPNAYGAWNEAVTSTTAGNSLNGEGQLYGSYNYALHNTDDATYTRVEAAYGSYQYVYSAGDTSLIDNAYGVYAYVRTGGTAAAATTAITTAYGFYGYINAGTANRNISTAYLLYLTSAETGTVTTKWGVYVNSTWPNFFNGNVILDGAVHYTPTVITPVSAGTTTLTTSTSIVMCNHTATIASHTFTFPSTGLTNGQQITITSRSAITTVTLSGGTFRNAITTLAAGGFAQYTYSSTGAAWFRTS